MSWRSGDEEMIVRTDSSSSCRLEQEFEEDWDLMQFYLSSDQTLDQTTPYVETNEVMCVYCYMCILRNLVENPSKNPCPISET